MALKRNDTYKKGDISIAKQPSYEYVPLVIAGKDFSIGFNLNSRIMIANFVPKEGNYVMYDNHAFRKSDK